MPIIFLSAHAKNNGGNKMNRRKIIAAIIFFFLQRLIFPAISSSIFAERKIKERRLQK